MPEFFEVAKKKKTEGFLGGLRKTGLRDFLGYSKKSSDFFWVEKF